MSATHTIRINFTDTYIFCMTFSAIIFIICPLLIAFNAVTKSRRSNLLAQSFKNLDLYVDNLYQQYASDNDTIRAV